jgi:hypothetical protein
MAGVRIQWDGVQGAWHSAQHRIEVQQIPGFSTELILVDFVGIVEAWLPVKLNNFISFLHVKFQFHQKQASIIELILCPE